MVTAAAARHHVPQRLAHGVIRVESGYRCNAKNPHSTAYGPGQLVAKTAAGLGVNPHNCAQNVDGAVRYMALAMRRAGGSLCKAATLYNKGIGAHAGCSAYGRKVLAMAR